MFELIEDIILSDFLILIVVVAMLVVVTSWAFRTGEYPGYVLGWLVGIFFIVTYRALFGDTSAAEETVETVETRLSFFTVTCPSFIGLLLGFGVLFFIRNFGASHARRALTVAIMTALLIIVLFFISTAGQTTRQVMGLFALAFSIGALSNLVVLIGPYGASVDAGAQGLAPRSRFDRLRRRRDDFPPR